MAQQKTKYLFTVTTYDENLVANGEWMGAAAVLGAAQDRQAFSF
jgi:hypothetical protein